MKMFGNACWDGRFGSVLVSPLTVFCCEGKPKQVFFWKGGCVISCSSQSL